MQRIAASKMLVLRLQDLGHHASSAVLRIPVGTVSSEDMRVLISSCLRRVSAEIRCDPSTSLTLISISYCCHIYCLVVLPLDQSTWLTLPFITPSSLSTWGDAPAAKVIVQSYDGESTNIRLGESADEPTTIKQVGGSRYSWLVFPSHISRGIVITSGWSFSPF